MASQFKLILIFVSVLVGVLSAAYFYFSTEIFMSLLQRPLKLVSGGMFVISIGVLLAALISYESDQGIDLYFYRVPLSAYFYVLYIIGSVLIFIGARGFAHRPKSKVVDVSLGKVA